MVETEFLNLERRIEIDYPEIAKDNDCSKLMKDIENYEFTDLKYIREINHSAERLIHNGRIVAFRLIEEPEKGSCVIVPGYETSQRYRDKYRRSAVKVELIADEIEKKEIRDSLKELGPVIFW